ncbi:hypothetical protein NLI96_g3437 [Meripilus lineatus]|uniref:Uncharacterized protein n=1 Tax=Meripilus lineatus TaxID=2056292 RepID=A0AAD5V6R7_9APHY|nr:hypothetical protein NLI96_g3437 [Physisporinus lineatus]
MTLEIENAPGILSSKAPSQDRFLRIDTALQAKACMAFLQCAEIRVNLRAVGAAEFDTGNEAAERVESSRELGRKR